MSSQFLKLRQHQVTGSFSLKATALSRAKKQELPELANLGDSGADHSTAAQQALSLQNLKPRAGCLSSSEGPIRARRRASGLPAPGRSRCSAVLRCIRQPGPGLPTHSTPKKTPKTPDLQGSRSCLGFGRSAGKSFGLGFSAISVPFFLNPRVFSACRPSDYHNG